LFWSIQQYFIYAGTGPIKHVQHVGLRFYWIGLGVGHVPKKHARVLKTIEVMTNPWRFTGDGLIDPNQLSDESIAISIMDFQEWWRY
jgi:hypothetical protein